MISIDLSLLFNNKAKLSSIKEYCKKADELCSDGEDVVLTGRASVWLYLAVGHALHGRARKLIYRSPVTGDVTIFDHDPF